MGLHIFWKGEHIGDILRLYTCVECYLGKEYADEEIQKKSINETSKKGGKRRYKESCFRDARVRMTDGD